MEPGSHKLYHVHGFHSRNFLDTYFSNKPEIPFAHETLKYPMKKFHNAFSTGNFKGDVLIDVSIGPVIHHLYASQEYFKDIILLKTTEHCIVEVKKWTNSRTGAFDWSHTSTLATEMTGKSDQCENKEIGLRTAITHVVKFDLNQENLTDPIVLPKADCLVFNCILEAISKDLQDFVRNFRRFSKFLKPGKFKGDVLIDVSTGPIIHYLYASQEYFKDIILLRTTEHCIVEVKKWINSRTGAFDWSHTSTLATEMAGKSDQCENKEIGLRAAITHVVKFDLNQENLTDPIVLPQADCLVLSYIPQAISKDLQDFVRNFRRFSKLLKPGGNLMYYGVLNGTFYVVGGEKFHMVTYNESNLRTMLSNEGFVITHLEVSQRKGESDLTDFDSVVFCTAYKE